MGEPPGFPSQGPSSDHHRNRFVNRFSLIGDGVNIVSRPDRDRVGAHVRGSDDTGPAHRDPHLICSKIHRLWSDA
jgi:hypothetical protein